MKYMPINVTYTWCFKLQHIIAIKIYYNVIHLSVLVQGCANGKIDPYY